MLKLHIDEKKIKILNLNEESYIRGTIGAKCQIELDGFWANYENTIVFKRDGYDPINVPIDGVSNEIEIPYTILAESGSFKIGLFGVKPNVVLPTLWSDEIKIQYGTDTHGTTPSKYEPNELDYLRLNKQDKLTAGSGIEIDENNIISAIGGSGTTNYNSLSNKPKINGVELSGDKTNKDLGINIPTKLSELDNDEGYVKDVLLADYYTKDEIDAKIGDIETALDELHNYAQAIIGGAE